MTLPAICEPVPLPPEQALLIETVRRPARSHAGDRFVHFHDAVELVLFERASGALHVETASFRIGERSLVVVPSLKVHDFALGEGEGAWTLLQMAPFVADAAAGEAYAPLLSQPLCVHLDEAGWRRAATLFDWLCEAARSGARSALALALIRSILGLASDAEPLPRVEEARLVGSGLGRLEPALDRLKARPGEPFAAHEAASLCRMSTAYFSRRFKAATGRTFSDYAAEYRLLRGAHRVLASDEPISRIAYETGFATPSHFAARFSARFGMSPRAYRKASSQRSRANGNGNGDH